MHIDIFWLKVKLIERECITRGKLDKLNFCSILEKLEVIRKKFVEKNLKRGEIYSI